MTGKLKNLWDEDVTHDMSEAQRLLYRSNLLGSDLRITNFGGGNTSAKIMETDPLSGAQVEILWVKGSGGDLRSMDLGGFATLYQSKLAQLKDLFRGREHEDEMVAYLSHCTFNLNTRAASIDTPLHTYIPYKHVDHMHPDSVIAIACTERSEELTKQAFGGRIGWLPWQRPGFDLGVKLGELAQAKPDLDGIVLAGHGLFTWGDTSRECYDTTLEIIQMATDWLAENSHGEPFGGQKITEDLGKDMRRAVAARLMPSIRGGISATQMKVGHFTASNAILEFVNSHDLARLASLGTSCPDHFLRTKIRPLVFDFDPATADPLAAAGDLAENMEAELDRYRADYSAYYDRCRRSESPDIRDANAVVYLIPGVGMMTFAKDKATARIAGEFYINAINVMRGAEAVDRYVALEEQEAFDIEYWLLEEAKLQRMPKPKSLSGHIAFITGGAGGIGSATAERMLGEAACVVIADIDATALEEKRTELAARFSDDVVASVTCDVTDEESIIAAMTAACGTFGGVDILVSNAGIASSAPLEETTLDLWSRNIDILTTGYFLVTREAFKVMKQQDLGGAIVYIASKNALVASPNASAYCTAKGAEVHLARAVALEGAPIGVRCNTVNPDAVLRGSKIWSGDWRSERASAYGMEDGDLDEHYRQRSLLKLNVYPEDIAEAVYFLASEKSAKSTGNIINVDAGHAPSFTR